MERTVGQQAREVTWPNQTIEGMARMQEAQAVHDKMQCHGMNEWVEDRET